jgi:hypothetical protein
MCELMGQRKYEGWRYLGYFLIAGGIIAALIAGVIWTDLKTAHDTKVWTLLGGLAAVVVGTATVFVERWFRGRYDPNNRRLADRKRRAADRSISLEDYDALQHIRLRTTYLKYVEEHVAESKKVQKRTGDADEKDGSPVIAWWVLSSVFLYGGTISFKLSDDDQATLVIPEDAKQGSILDLATHTPGVLSFRVCVYAINVHADETRMEDENSP